MSEINVRSHRAGKRGYDSGFIPIPTAETDLVSETVYVNSIYISNTSTSPIDVILKQKSDNLIIYNRTIAVGDRDLLFFPEPVKFDGGIRFVASGSGVVISVVGYFS